VWGEKRMSNKKLKVLLVIEQCNPDWASVPLVGYRYYQEISQLADVTLVTHDRNRAALEKYQEHQNIVYSSESSLIKAYYKWVEKVAAQGKINWPLYNALCFPIYAEFDRQVYQQFKDQVSAGEYDLIHALTPMIPRYPVKLVQFSDLTPLLLGPVNGGVPFPKGFQAVARQENAYLNFLRVIGRYLIPGYVQTYQKATKILAGSTYTLEMLRNLFSISNNRIELFYENGITSNFLTPVIKENQDGNVHLLFVGRLVPYKCADVVIEAVGKLMPSVRDLVRLTIVGDGSEKSILEQRVQELGIQNRICFAGWVNQDQTVEYYRKADVFCFPSIREFGGAVVLEAMACGLPCIVANNGGIGEYVTEETGFRIEPLSKDYVIQEMTNCIHRLVEDEPLRRSMAKQSIDRAKSFEWSEKAKNMISIYEKMLALLELP
jgi:glycosyltransferase involved in cell wall biosynthesis